MYEIHTTKNGESMLICCMTDSHLTATIKSHCSRLQAAVAILTNKAADDPLVAVFQPKFSNAALKERAQETVQFVHKRLQPYVVEASLRGLDIRETLQTAYGRSAGVGTQELLLPGSMSLSEVFSADAYDEGDYEDYSSQVSKIHKAVGGSEKFFKDLD